MIEDLGYSIICLYQNLWGRMQRPYILGGGYRFLRFTFCRLLQRSMRRPAVWVAVTLLSLITYHLSLITYHLSLITFHLSQFRPGYPRSSTNHQSLITNHFSPLAYRVAETSSFLASPAPTSTSAEPFSLFASQVTKYLPAGKYKCGVES